MSARDDQVGGDHYRKHDMQPIDIIDAYDLNFYEGNALKYLLRYKDKNGVQDLKKAAHYIEMLIEREEKNPNLPVKKTTAPQIKVCASCSTSITDIYFKQGYIELRPCGCEFDEGDTYFAFVDSRTNE